MSSLKKIKIFKNNLLCYDGEVDKNNKKNGYGISYIDGIKEYEGYWENNLFHGDGSYYKKGELLISSYNKNKILIGKWVNGVFHGLGVDNEFKEFDYQLKKEDIYEGKNFFYNHDGVWFN